jgi:trans-2,3-dihydro-3-hydroxyanthranilate isomerase
MAADRRYRFAQVDVFSERAFAGNQLAVVFDAEDLSATVMQDIAREMNLAETTFILPSRRPDCAARVRIFTPAREMPFAGHPTIGTAWVLAANGLVPGSADRFRLDEEIGPVPVELEGDPRAPCFVWMRHRDATFEAEVRDRDGVAAALGLKVDDLLPHVPIESGSTGNAFLYVPLRDAATVDRVVLDARRLEDVAPATAAIGVFVLAPDPDPAARRVYTRMFAPAHGVAEDPATGSASGALGAYLVRHGLVRAEGDTRIVSEQGTKMRRQSFVHIALTARETIDGHGETFDGRGTSRFTSRSLVAVTDLRVGGSVVPVLDGTIRVPAS